MNRIKTDACLFRTNQKAVNRRTSVSRGRDLTAFDFFARFIKQTEPDFPPRDRLAFDSRRDRDGGGFEVCLTDCHMRQRQINQSTVNSQRNRIDRRQARQVPLRGAPVSRVAIGQQQNSRHRLTTKSIGQRLQ